MRILNKEEADAITPVSNGRETLVSSTIKQLQVGQGLIITRQDWKAKYPPTTIVNSISKKTGRKFEKGRMPDGSGWFVKRVA